MFCLKKCIPTIFSKTNRCRAASTFLFTAAFASNKSVPQFFPPRNNCLSVGENNQFVVLKERDILNHDVMEGAIVL